MNDHRQLIEKFYTSFQHRDGNAMAACYHADILFYDPVFLNLHGAEAGTMWKMLCSSARELEISFSNISADEEYGSCNWEADYLFSATGRKVHNVVSARFRFRDGLIIEHMDDFDFWKWSRQALGMSGTLLGWSPVVKNKVRKSARKNLNAFISKQHSL